MAYRPYYKVERGTRVYVSGMTGQALENSYTVKTPIVDMGEYSLLSLN